MSASRVGAGLVGMVALASTVLLAPSAAAEPVGCCDAPSATAQQQGHGYQTGQQVPGSPGQSGAGDGYVNENYQAPNCWYVPSSAQEYRGALSDERALDHHSGDDQLPGVESDWKQRSDEQAAHADDTTGTFYKLQCDDWLGDGANRDPFTFVQNGDPAPPNVLTPYQAAQLAMKYWPAPDLRVTLTPNPPAPSTVNLATKVTVENPGVQHPETAEGPLDLELTVVPSVKLSTDAPATFSPGGGDCPASGGTFACAVTFQHASIGKPAGYTLRSTVTWTATWSLNGVQQQPALEPLVVPNDVNVPVREIQTKVTESN